MQSFPIGPPPSKGQVFIKIKGHIGKVSQGGGADKYNPLKIKSCFKLERKRKSQKERWSTFRKKEIDRERETFQKERKRENIIIVPLLVENLKVAQYDQKNIKNNNFYNSKIVHQTKYQVLSKSLNET